MDVARGARALSVSGALGVLAALSVTACDSTGVNNVTSIPLSFSQTITYPGLQSGLTTGATRVEIQVFADSLVARRVRLDDADDMTQSEEIDSRVTALGVGTNGIDTLTLALGGIRVTFNAATVAQAVALDDNGDNDMGGVGNLVARVQADLTAGKHPGVRARRAAPAQPQGPTDGTFLASRVELDEDAALPLIAMNVNSANLITNTTPPPDGYAELLGIKIALEVSNGVTKLEQENHGLKGTEEFEGAVKSVDITGSTATLMNGTVLKIVLGTEFRDEPEDNTVLTTLPAVQKALAAGDTVRAVGRGLAISANPDTLDVIEVSFVVKTEEEHEAPPGIVEFNDTLASVDVTHSKFTLGNGTVVNVVAGTLLMGQVGLTTLQLASDSLAAHVRVHAEGRGLITAAGPPPVLDGIFVNLEAGQ
jgi:hypothetical protein